MIILLFSLYFTSGSERRGQSGMQMDSFTRSNPLFDECNDEVNEKVRHSSGLDQEYCINVNFAISLSGGRGTTRSRRKRSRR